MDSHYIPAFAERDDRWPKAVCGVSSRFVTFEHSAEPSCPRCRAWIEADVAAAQALEQLWADEAAARLPEAWKKLVKA